MDDKTKKLLEALTDKKNLAKGGVVSIILFYFIGLFGDFQILKSDVQAMEVAIIEVRKELRAINDLKDIHCEVAIHTFREDNKLPEKILKHCR
jgi:hypothetical protein